VDDYVNMGDVTFLDSATNCTIQCWFKADVLPDTSETNQKQIIGKLQDDNGDVNTFKILLDGTSGTPKFRGKWVYSDNTEINLLGSTNPAAGIWYHIVFVLDSSSSSKLYINGVLDGQDNTYVGKALKNSSASLMVGRRSDINVEPKWFDGLIDDVRIYNYARSITEIQAEYNARPRVVATFPLAKTPNGGSVVSPDGSKIFVGVSVAGDYSAGEVTVLNAANGTVIANISVGYGPNVGALTPDGNYGYATNTVNGYYATKFNAVNNTKVGDVGTGTDSSGMAITPDGLYCYMANHWSSVVSVIRISDNTNIASIGGIDSGGYDVAITPDGQYAYVLGRTGNIYKINTSNNQLISTITKNFGGSGANVSIAISPDGQYFYIAGRLESILHVYSTVSDTEIRTVSFPSNLSGVDVTPDGNYIYVLRRDGGLSIVSAANYNIVDTISIAGTDQFSTMPAGIAFSPNGKYAYISNNVTNKIIVIDTGNTLKGWWKFDETSGTTAGDVSGNGNNGTVYGATWSGGALSFDGVDDYVNVGNGLYNQELTIQCWIYPTEIRQQVIFSKEMNNTGYQVFMGSNGTINVGMDGLGASGGRPSGSTVINTNQWTHVVIVMKSGIADGSAIYINGVLEDTGTGTISTGATNPVDIGRKTDGTLYFIGKIDDVKIYNYARSATDILAEYNASLAVDDYVWVANNSSNTVTRITKSTSATNTTVVGTGPWGVAVDETYCWVTNRGNDSGNTVTRIKKSDLTTNTITVGTGPIGVTVDETYCWVTNWGGGSGNTVTRIKKSDSSTTTITVGTGPWGVAVDGTYCWVANYGSGGSSGNTVTRIKKLDLTTTTITVGTGPVGVAVDETYCWVTNQNSDTVTRIQKSDSITTTITVGTRPEGVVVDGTYCWVTNEGSNNVTRIKKSDLTKDTITVGTTPYGIAVDATYCWVANRGSNNVIRILKSDITNKTTLALGSYPASLGDMTGWAYDNYSNK
jgi:YVTN family beta-propeller protein